MGKQRRSGSSAEATTQLSLDAFVSALQRQLADKQRTVRAFDVGGTGVKTALLSSAALREFLFIDSANLPVRGEGTASQVQWIDPPSQLGTAPGEEGFASWLLEAVPRLRREVDDPSVCFGVSVGGDVDHATGVLQDWWPGGGHPRSWGASRPNPLLADIMGLPPARTFVLHDGEAHLLGCSRCAVPPPSLACLAIGTGVGFGLSDASGAVVDPCSTLGARSLALGGVPVSGAAYRGIWQRWLDTDEGQSERVQALMAKPFANMKRPWNTPWVSLLLGRRGMELAEAAHGAPEPGASGLASAAEASARAPAVRAYAAQWLHFLHTQLLPQFGAASRAHRAERLCFAGGIAEANWEQLEEVLIEPSTDQLQPLPPEAEGAQPGPLRGRKAAAAPKAQAARGVRVLPPAPAGSALIGVAIYALAGAGGAAAGIWAR